MKKFILEQSDNEFYTSHSGLALIGLCINRFSDLPKQVARKMTRRQDKISHADIVRSMLREKRGQISFWLFASSISSFFRWFRNDLSVISQALIRSIALTELYLQRPPEVAMIGWYLIFVNHIGLTLIFKFTFKIEKIGLYWGEVRSGRSPEKSVHKIIRSPGHP